MLNPEIIDPFYDYLNRPTDRVLPWEDMGLVENAPPEAIKAYEEYKKIMKDAENDEDPTLF